MSLHPIIQASLVGDLKQVKELCINDPTKSILFQVNNEGSTPIIAATTNGHLEVVKFMVTQDINLIQQKNNNNGMTAFLEGCANNHLNIVKYLLEHDPSIISHEAIDGCTGLHFACQKGHLDVAMYLLSEAPCLMHETNNQGHTALHLARLGDCLKLMKIFSQQHSSEDNNNNDNNDGDDNDAAREKTGRDIANFLKTEINVCQSIIVDFEPLRLTQAPWMVPQDQARPKSIHDACEIGDLDLVKKMSEAIHETNDKGMTAHHIACSSGHLEVVRYLLKLDKTLIYQQDNSGCLGFHHACKNGHLEVVKYLLQVDQTTILYHQDNEGWTALHFACENGHLEVTKYLLLTSPMLFHSKNHANELPCDLVPKDSDNQELLDFLKGFSLSVEETNASTTRG